MKKVLLYSGGMDSWLIDKLWKPDIRLYIDVQGNYSKQELARLPADVVVERLDIGKFELEDMIIPLRNLFFVMMATYYGEVVCLGTTSGDRPLDKGPEFASRASELLSFLLQKQRWTEGKKVEVVMPYKDYSKAQLLSLYLQKGGTIKEALSATFSCYHPIHNSECWGCKACVRKAAAFIANGHQFPQEVNNKLLQYLEEEVPYILSTDFSRGQEDKELFHVYQLLKEKQR